MFLKFFQYSPKNNFIKKRLKHTCFLVNIHRIFSKIHRITPVLESLLTPLQACSLQLYWKRGSGADVSCKFFRNFLKQCFCTKHFRVILLDMFLIHLTSQFKITRFHHIALHILISKCDMKVALAGLWRKQIFFLIRIRFNILMQINFLQ